MAVICFITSFLHLILLDWLLNCCQAYDWFVKILYKIVCRFQLLVYKNHIRITPFDVPLFQWSFSWRKWVSKFPLSPLFTFSRGEFLGVSAIFFYGPVPFLLLSEKSVHGRKLSIDASEGNYPEIG